MILALGPCVFLPKNYLYLHAGQARNKPQPVRKKSWWTNAPAGENIHLHGMWGPFSTWHTLVAQGLEGIKRFREGAGDVTQWHNSCLESGRWWVWFPVPTRGKKKKRFREPDVLLRTSSVKSGDQLEDYILQGGHTEQARPSEIHGCILDYFYCLVSSRLIAVHSTQDKNTWRLQRAFR